MKTRLVSLYFSCQWGIMAPLAFSGACEGPVESGVACKRDVLREGSRTLSEDLTGGAQ